MIRDDEAAVAAQRQNTARAKRSARAAPSRVASWRVVASIMGFGTADRVKEGGPPGWAQHGGSGGGYQAAADAVSSAAELRRGRRQFKVGVAAMAALRSSAPAPPS
eukprot:CAMPEP_0179889742 /NCGR_PEP_ID=MMETSP0982-20121206/32714_1 /TAXON_ID=483367 /ORGANISM="non described non described, Strain CCMP 2436" /LENGTH=105 /DNA_ID=CAMNT_0021785885 /DNA_START=520 /DNA_END=838 /DNA_ORIENTATION=-